MTDALWQLGGWTMLHFLWVGTGVALIGGALRFACRRAAPAVRYAVSLATLAVLAALPLAIAAYLYSPAILAGVLNPVTPRYSEGSGVPPEAARFAPSNMPSQSSEGNSPSQDGSAIFSDAPRVIDLAEVELAEPMAPPVTAKEISAPPKFDLPSLAAIVATLPWLWLVGAPLTFALLATGLVGSERLRRTSAPLADGPAAVACERLRQAMRITRRVTVAVCDGVAQPVLVGIVRPLILLPAAALSGWTPAELEMVLLHELAHVRRWDNLVNLVQRIVESALFFHPAVWLASRQVRRDREECCDAIVVARVGQPEAYASLLVSIAATLRRGQAPPLAAASAMADHPLAGRVRRILKLEDEPMWISRRTLALTLVMPLLLVAAVIYSGVAADEGSPGSPNQGGVATKDIAVDNDAAPTPNEEAPRPVAPLQEPAPHGLDGEVELPKLRGEITRLQGLIAKETENLVDAHIFNQLALQSVHTRGEVEWAVAAIMDNDAKIADYQKRMSALQEAIQQRHQKTRNPNDSQLKQLVAQMRSIQLELEKHRAAAEKAARKQLADMPKEELRISDVEYKIRREAGIKKLDEYEKQLDAANSALVESSHAHARSRDAKVPAKPQPAFPSLEPRAAFPSLEPQAAFPSLEHQKIADRAYKLLGIDFEPINVDELARVKERGYEGGLRVDGIGKVTGLDAGDILVGLHVWPTTDLETLDAILVREDLQELAPLKYRVVRVTSGNFGGGGKPEVIMGRINIEQDALYGRELSKAAEQLAQIETFAPEPADPYRTTAADGPWNSEPTPPNASGWSHGPAIQWRNNLDEAKAEAARSGRPILLYFYTRSSRPNREFEEIVLAHKAVSDRLNSVFIPVKVDADASPAIAAQYRVDRVPTQMVISPLGKTIATLNTSAEPDKYLHELSSVPIPYASGDVLIPMQPAPAIGTLPGELPAPKDQPLKPGTVVKIVVAGAFPEQPIDGAYPIETAGTVALGPVYGRVPIAGKTVLEAEAAVQKHLSAMLTDAKVQLTRAELAPLDTGGNATYLYDGKTFEDWRSLWKHELKTERRTEAIVALAAFGRAGRGQEAAEAILDVAGEYDFRTLNDDNVEGQLHLAVLDVMQKFPTAQWLPSLVGRIEKGEGQSRANYVTLAISLLHRVRVLDAESLELVTSLAKDTKLGLQDGAFAALVNADPTLKDPGTLSVLREALAGGEPVMAALMPLGFEHLDEVPEQMELLFHANPQVQIEARRVLGAQNRAFFGGMEGVNVGPWLVMERLLAILDDPDRAKDHVAAIRAIKAGAILFGSGEMQPVRAKTIARLQQVLRDGDDELLAPAILALRGLVGMDLTDMLRQAELSDERMKHLQQIYVEGERLRAKGREAPIK